VEIMVTAAIAPNRLDRRKARTRRALIDAARQLLAGGTTEVSIQEITDAADVGFGSFYNHFPTKADLFHAAIAEVLEEHGRHLDELTAGMTDPAEVFAASVRMTARLINTHPQIARILAHTGMTYLADSDGLAPRALRDIQRAADAGRFRIGNPYVALAAAGGSLIALLHVWLADPEVVDDDACDELAEQLLRMFGMTAKTARALAHRPLPSPN